MKIRVYLKDSPKGFDFDNVIDTFQEGALFCVYTKSEVMKFPIMHIFKIRQID